MSDLDQMWTKLLDEASLEAINSGRSDVADYLRLKLANDTIRRSGVDWLFDTLIGLACELQRPYHNLKIERTSPHSFKIGLSTMIGSLVDIRYGVRCLSLEAGWVRSPSDGVMRDGALANARLRHFGMSSEETDYRLVRGTSFPGWIDDAGIEMSPDGFRRQLAVLLDH